MELGGLMQERRRYDRRTGVALLSLVAATNVIPWMELLLGETVTAELLAPSRFGWRRGRTWWRSGSSWARGSRVGAIPSRPGPGSHGRAPPACGSRSPPPR